MTEKQDYHSFRPWIRWLPYPVLIWLSLRNIGKGHIWFQSRRLGVQLGLSSFTPSQEKEHSPCGCEIVRNMELINDDGTKTPVTALYYPKELD